jgi:hypothetical protein
MKDSLMGIGRFTDLQPLFQCGNIMEGDHFEDLRTDGTIILKLIT